MNERPPNLFGFKVKILPVEGDLAQFLDRVKEDSSYMPLDIDLMEFKVIFYQLSATGYRKSPFLREEFLFMPGQNAYSVDLDSLLSLEEKSFEPASCSGSFIFHHGFGGSSYLANFLMNTEKFFVLKEPMALQKLAFLIGNKIISQQKHDLLLKTLMRMYLRKCSLGPSLNKRIAIKGSGNTPIFVEKFLKDFPSIKTVFLFQELEDLLVAVDTNDRRANAEQCLKNTFIHSFLKETPIAELIDEIEGKDFYYFTTLYWFVINEHMKSLASKSPSFHQLSTNALYAAPEKKLMELSSFLDEPMELETIRGKLKSELVMKRHSKNPFQLYDGEKEKLKKENKKKSMKKEIKLSKKYAQSLQDRFS